MALSIASDYEDWGYLRRSIKWYQTFQRCMALYVFQVSRRPDGRVGVQQRPCAEPVRHHAHSMQQTERGRLFQARCCMLWDHMMDHLCHALQQFEGDLKRRLKPGTVDPEVRRCSSCYT